ncbi:MAG TPA: lysylphosphatidylglycerol synthase transmembrane domain-containing protein [Candidatus Polarisedimenticolaceae bacterium]
MKQVLSFVLGLALAAAIFVWVLHDTDLRAVGTGLAGASVGGLLLGAALNLGHNVFRVWRWRYLLEPVRKDVPFRPMGTSVVVGYLVSWVVPGRLGEVVRPMLLSSREKLPLGPCLGTVAADRLLDGVAIVVLAAIGLLLAPLHGEAAAHAGSVKTTAWSLVGVLAAGIVLLMTLSAAGTWVERRLIAFPGPVRWGVRALLSLARGTDALRSPRILAIASAHSALAWLTIAAGTWVGVRAAGADVPFGAILVMLPLLALGVAVPTPGGAGGYHGAMKWGLTVLFGVPPDIAVAAGLLMHLAIVVPILVLGPVLLHTDRISWGDLIDGARNVRALGSAPAGSEVAS